VSRLERVFDVRSPQQAEQVPVGVREQHTSGAGFGQVMRHLVHADIGPIRARGRVHDVLDRRFGRHLEGFATHVAEDDALFVDDDAQVGVQVADSRPEMTGRDIADCQLADTRLAGQVAFEWQAVSQPVDLTRDVAVDVAETERFEPPRGSRAQVSLHVLTVDDDRPLTTQRVLGSVAAQVAQR
jgi:hypothetical protein